MASTYNYLFLRRRRKTSEMGLDLGTRLRRFASSSRSDGGAVYKVDQSGIRRVISSLLNRFPPSLQKFPSFSPFGYFHNFRKKMSRIHRSSCSMVALVLLVMTALLAVYVTSVQADGEGMTGGEGGEISAMADAIKYLQGLDKVYGQATRPRYTRNTYSFSSSSPSFVSLFFYWKQNEPTRLLRDTVDTAGAIDPVD